MSDRTPDRLAIDAVILDAWQPFGEGSPILQQRRARMAQYATDALIRHRYITDEPRVFQARIDAALAVLDENGEQVAGIGTLDRIRRALTGDTDD